MILMTIILFSLLIGSVALQIFLSRLESKWLGLILPIITFLYSIVAVLNVASFEHSELWQTLGKILTVFLTTNGPTAVFLAIYHIFRKKRHRKKQLDKMNVMDLE